MTTVQRIKRGWMNLRIERIIQETPDTRTLILVDDDEGGRCFDYNAGQYLTFRFDTLAPKPLVRSYTLSSSPLEQDHIAVTVKETAEGFISKYLTRKLQEGEVLRARGPMGKFCYHSEHDGSHLVMIAAGSGVTPFISIMREYAQRLGQLSCPAAMTLIVGFRHVEDIICHALLEEWRKIAGIRIFVSLSQESGESKSWDYHHGRIDKAYLAKLLSGDLSDCSFMTCGPEGLMKTSMEFLRGRGVGDERVHTESFA
jgi:ferredoxin-NADP reductase